MMLDDKDAIEIARNFLIEKCADAAEPLWALDDFGNEIYCDIGCANWVNCEVFEIQDEPQPRVERDEDGRVAIIQAKVKWSHWGYTVIREFMVPFEIEDGNWVASTSFDWDDVEVNELE